MRYTDKQAEVVIKLLGGRSYEGVSVTDDQFNQLRRFYRIEDREDDGLLRAIDERNVFRASKIDGLRVMAFLAGYLDRGEDPVLMVARVLRDRGYDVGLGEEDEPAA